MCVCEGLDAGYAEKSWLTLALFVDSRVVFWFGGGVAAGLEE